MNLAKTSSPFIGEPRQKFSKEEIKNLSSLGDVLRQIRSRLKSEGVSIEDARQELLKNSLGYNIYETQKSK